MALMFLFSKKERKRYCARGRARWGASDPAGTRPGLLAMRPSRSRGLCMNRPGLVLACCCLWWCAVQLLLGPAWLLLPACACAFESELRACSCFLFVDF